MKVKKKQQQYFLRKIEIKKPLYISRLGVVILESINLLDERTLLDTYNT